MLNSDYIQVRVAQNEKSFDFKTCADVKSDVKWRKDVCENSEKLIRLMFDTWHDMSDDERVLARKLVANAWERLCAALHSDALQEHIMMRETKRACKSAKEIKSFSDTEWHKRMHHACKNAYTLVYRMDINDSRYWKMLADGDEGKNYAYHKELQEENKRLLDSLNAYTFSEFH